MLLVHECGAYIWAETPGNNGDLSEGRFFDGAEDARAERVTVCPKCGGAFTRRNLYEPADAPETTDNEDVKALHQARREREALKRRLRGLD